MQAGSLLPWTTVLGIAVGLAHSVSAAALDRERSITQFVRESWTIRDGGPAGTINAITQTPDGYLWLATEGEGLLRFDGVSFTRDEGPDTLFGRRVDQITSLISARDGALWVGTPYGLARLREGHWVAFDRGDAKHVSGLHEAPDGVIWYARHWEGLFRVSGETVTPLPLAGRPRFVTTDKDDRLWAAGYEGLWLLSGGRQRFLTTADGLPDQNVNCLYGDGSEGVWLGFNQAGLVLMRDGTAALQLQGRDGLSSDDVSVIHRDRDGILWVGTLDGGLNRLRNGRFEVLTTTHGLTANDITALYEGREGSLWIGTSGGLNRLRDASLLPIGAEEGLSPRQPLSIVEGTDGTVFVSSGFGGLNRIRDGRIEVLPPGSVPGSNFDGPLYADPDGGVWSPHRDHLAYRGPRGTRRYRVEGQVTSITGDARGLVFAAGTGEVFRLVRGRPERYRLADGSLLGPETFGFDYVWMLHVARDGTLWLATSRGAIAVREGRAVSRWHRATLSARSVFEDAAGVIWLGTMAGVVRVRGASVDVFATAQGLAEEDVHNVLNDGRGGLWISGARGLYRANLREVEDVAEGRAERFSVEAFGVTEGMRSPVATARYQPSACLASDGRLWFATAAGVVVVNPDRIRRNEIPPPVIVERVVGDGIPLAPAGEIRVPADTEQLTIHYSGLSLLVPEKVRFQYQLEGYDRSWVDAGARRVAFYTKPPPGRYVFRVKAANNDGVWNEVGATVRLRVMPPFWTTPLFRMAAALLLVGALVVTHKLRVRHVQAIARDLAEKVEERTHDLNRLNAELAERTRQSTTRLQTVVTSAPIVLFSLDRDGVFALSDGKGLAGMGLTPGELVGRSVFDVYRDRPDILQNMRRALAGESFSAPVTVGDHVFEAYHTPLPDQGGERAGTSVVLVDVTERRRAEEGRARLQSQLLQAQKMESVGRLAGGIAHDFNNMLHVITGFTGLLKLKMPRDEKLSAYVSEIEHAAERAKDVTFQLLAFSRKQPVSPVPSDLKREIARMSGALPRLIGEDVELKVGGDDRLWAVRIDPTQIDQILLNLAVNARDAMPRGGKLTIETANVRLDESYCRQHSGAEPGDYVLLAVSDDGVGMDEETVSQIFEPFFTTKESGRGTGLGLATVYGIVKQNGGHVSVYSKPGEGTTFKLYLPRTLDAAAARPSVSERVTPVGSGTVLVVEDEDSVRRLTAALVESIGYTVIAAAGPAEAISVCEQDEPAIDVVLTDVVMPGMAGTELRDRLEKLRPGIRVVFTSGYTASVIAHHGILEEGVHFIAKPFGVAALARKLGEVLAGEG